MSRSRKMMTAGVTFSAALAVGFVMQNGNAFAERSTDVEAMPAPVQSTVLVEPSVALRDVDLPEDAGPFMVAPEVHVTELKVPASIDPVVTDIVPILVASTGPDDPISELSDEIALNVDCVPEMAAEATAYGMVNLTVDASCYPQARFTVHHQGMMFSVATDEDGQFAAEVPALTENAVFIAAFDDGMGAVASATVPDVSDLDRAVLQWQGNAAVGIHAFEFGAEFGADGHVWMDAPRSPSAAANGQGFLVRLGNADLPEPLIAEVYTYPTAHSASGGAIELSVEASITIRNCGRDVAAQSIQIGPEHDAEAVDLQVTMPDCDAVGDFLVLKNMFTDLTLAAK
ncbi:hypothetical protein [Marivivens sp. JLT3646]|uniref:hypothetical protein n=1 Tax=Marivivens sp. JLT3646 TaxID=1920883 RepID=UPI00080116B2|nr:hypothetical protein [Marivivens sp. JLT3646]APO88428.1 hypothetical protein BSK21_13955 [Marivivens sp. JLT3646]OBR35148.1 hypothetical protein A9199_11605 [Donghicola sp. JL3646]